MVPVIIISSSVVFLFYEQFVSQLNVCAIIFPPFLSVCLSLFSLSLLSFSLSLSLSRSLSLSVLPLPSLLVKNGPFSAPIYLSSLAGPNAAITFFFFLLAFYESQCCLKVELL